MNYLKNLSAHWGRHCLLFCVLIPSSALLAEQMTESVIVSAPRAKTAAETVMPVTTLFGDELRREAAASLGETLASKPGLASASFGPAVGQPIIRGQQGVRVSVLQNGLRSADVSQASPDHAVSVEPLLTERIEVIRGSSTLLYGGGAIGGVVNVLDRRIPLTVPEASGFSLETRHDTVNDGNTLVFSGESVLDNWVFHADALRSRSGDVRIPEQQLGAAEDHDEHDEDDGHEDEHHEEAEKSDSIDNSFNDKKMFTLGGSYHFDQGLIGLAVSRLEQQYGIPAGAHEHHDEEEDDEHEHEEHDEGVSIDLEQTRYDARFERSFADSGIEQLRWSLAYTDYQHDELEGAEIGTRWMRDSFEQRLELLHAGVLGGEAVTGIQWLQTELEADGEESYLPESETTAYALFFLQQWQHQQWQSELGLRIGQDEVEPKAISTEDFTTYSVSASTLYSFNQQWSLGLSYSHAERAPIADELYANHGAEFGGYVEHVAAGVIELGNDQLDVEQSENLDISLRYRSDRFSAQASLFYNDFHDFIYLANTGLEQDEVEVFQYRQQGAKFMGMELEADFALYQMAGGELNLSLFADWVDGELDNGNDVPRLPPRSLGSRLQFSNDATTAYVSLLHAAAQDKPGINETDTNGYDRWDAGIEQRLQLSGNLECLLFLRLKNITDEEIRNASSFLRDVAPEPGRNAQIGFRLSY